MSITDISRSPLPPFAVIEHVLHDGIDIAAFCEFHYQLLGHEIYYGLLDALGPVGGFLHEVGAVGAVHLDAVGLLHGTHSPLKIHILI